MSSPTPEKPSWEERIRSKIQIKKFLRRHPRIEKIVYSDFVWGVIFAILIVILLLPLEGFDRKTYSLTDVVQENIIIAPQDIRIPDIESTQKKRDERLAALKTVYTFDDTQWDKHFSQINAIFDIGQTLVAAELSSEENPETQQLSEQLAQDNEFIDVIEQALESNVDVSISVPREIVQILVRESFSADLKNQIIEILKNVLEKPIVNTTRYPPLSSGYELRALDDKTKEDQSILSLVDARVQIRLNAQTLVSSLQGGKAISDWLELLVEPTAIPDDDEMLRLRTEAGNVETLYFEVKRGEVIARQGDKISDTDQLAKINFIISSSSRGLNYWFRAISLAFFVTLFLYTLHKFSVWHKRRRKVSYHLFLLLCLTLGINLGFIKLVMMIGDSFAAYLPATTVQDYYWAAPFAIGSMLITLLTGVQIAALYSIILVYLSGFLFGGNFTVLLYSLIGSFVAIYGLRQYKERTALIKSGIALGLMNIIAIIAISLHNDSLKPFTEMLLPLTMGFVGGMLASFIVSFVLPLFESLFKIVTDIKLLELSNHEHPLLRNLFINAPGTFQHSIVVGYLAEAAATSINANALFCRVSCLYHDIGKMVKSQYYVENTDDLGRKHDKLTPHMSALVIINHVKEGMELGRKYRLPESIIDIIPQHHGTKIIRYFYEKARANRKPDDVQVEEAEFRYPGPKPQTREAGIIMIADGVEAAARSLDEPTPGRLKGTIKAIIESTFLDGQLDECDLTLKDLTKISEAFLKVLVTMKHERIKYPGFQLEKDKRKLPREQKNNMNGIAQKEIAFGANKIAHDKGNENPDEQTLGNPESKPHIDDEKSEVNQ